MITAENIQKSYGNLNVLNNITLNINKGEIISIVGPSGAGKSTLLQILGTLEKPSSGSLIINGNSTELLKKDKLAAFRNKEIGFVFQFHHLLPEFTALENVCIPGFIGGGEKSATIDKAKELLKLLGLSNSCLLYTSPSPRDPE